MTVEFDQPTFDVLVEAIGGEGAAEVVKSYLETTPMLLDRLRTAVATGNTNEAKRSAHDLKSTSSALGALACAELATTIESRAATGSLGDLAELDRMVSDLVARFEVVRARLSLYLETVSGA